MSFVQSILHCLYCTQRIKTQTPSDFTGQIIDTAPIWYRKAHGAQMTEIRRILGFQVSEHCYRLEVVQSPGFGSPCPCMSQVYLDNSEPTFRGWVTLRLPGIGQKSLSVHSCSPTKRYCFEPSYSNSS